MANQLAVARPRDDGEAEELGGPEGPVGPVRTRFECQVHAEVQEVHGVGELAEEHEDAKAYEAGAEAVRAEDEVHDEDGGRHRCCRLPPDHGGQATTRGP